MNRIHPKAFRLLIGSIFLLAVFVGGMQAQTPPAQESTKPADAKPEQKPDLKQAQDNPFGLEKAPPLPAGMTGSPGMTRGSRGGYGRLGPDTPPAARVASL